MIAQCSEQDNAQTAHNNKCTIEQFLAIIAVRGKVSVH